MILLEVCVEGAENAALAAAAGADRIELCAALSEGGISPTPAMLRATLAAVDVPVMAMLRPRGGGYVCSDAEIGIMRDDAAWMAEAGAAGLVLGCLTPEDEIDRAALRRMPAGLPVTFHRAFESVADQLAALDILVDHGIARVLTSGPHLDRLVDHAAGRIAILACGGLRPHNIARVRQQSGAREMHFSAPLDGDLRRTDPALVRAIIAAARA